VAHYAVELYLPRLRPDELSEAIDSAAAAARRTSPTETQVRFSRSLFLPGDEVCFLLFEAPSACAVESVVRSAGITFERVIQAELHGTAPGQPKRRN
jgi:hypothetical protein